VGTPITIPWVPKILVQVGLSVGGTVCRQELTSLENLFIAAEEALDKAKNLGGNKCCIDFY
jgi:hypothetical protein